MNISHKKKIIFASLLVLAACAKQSAPTGGPKDEKPPIALQSSPINYATNFNGKKIIIEFDEYLNLQNVNSELLVSPPLEKRPKILMRGKKLVIHINNELKDSTTYNFNFFNSIADLNEGNILENFQFEFSTGDNFDSTYISGIVLDAFTKKPIEGVNILCYRNISDTTIQKIKPECVGKTNKDGLFIVSNMRNEPYHIFALSDMNNNLLYDMPNEMVGFLENPISAGFTEIEVSDTIRQIKSISNDKKDTVFVDSIHTHKMMVTTESNLIFNIFKEETKNQYLKDNYRYNQRLLCVTFNNEIDSLFTIKPIIDTTFADNWCLFESKPITDSVLFWVTDSVLYQRDTLNIDVAYKIETDTNTFVKHDTLQFIYTQKRENKKNDTKKEGGFLSKLLERENNNKSEDKPKSELKVSTNLKGTFDLNKSISLTTNYPIKSFLPEKFFVKNIEEDKNEKITIEKTEERKIEISFAAKESMKYKLVVKDSAIFDIYQNANDSVANTFNTQKSDYYSTIIMNLKGIKCNSVMQILDSKEKLIKEYYVANDTTIKTEYLNPSVYIYKLYEDKNNNKKWDTGDLKNRQQPEPVYYYDVMLETKSGWDIKETWVIE